MEDVHGVAADAAPGQEQLSKRPGDSSLEDTLRTGRSVLLYSEPSQSGVWRRNRSIPPFCMFRMGLDQEPPDDLYQVELIRDTYMAGKVFFICHDNDNTYSSSLRKEEREILRKDEKLKIMALEWYRVILWRYMHARDEHTFGTSLSHRDTDPNYGLPIQEGVGSTYVKLRRWLKRGSELVSDSDDLDGETAKKQMELERLGPCPSSPDREYPALLIPEKDKLYERGWRKGRD